MSTESGAPRSRFDAYRYHLASKGQPRTARALPGLARSGLGLARRASPRLLWIVVTGQAIAALLLAVQVVLGKEVIQAVLDESQGGGSIGPVIPPLVGLAVATGASGLLSAAQTNLQRLLGEKVQFVTMESVVDVTTRVPLTEFEAPGFFDHLQRVKVNALMRPLTLVTGLVQVIGGGLAVVGLAAAVFVIAPLLLPILLAAAIPLGWLSRRSGQLEFRFAVQQAGARRLRSYLEAVLSGRDEAKEVRAFDLAVPLRQRWLSSYERYFGDLDAHVRRRLALALASAAVTVVATCGSLALLTWFIVDGRIKLASAGAALIAIRLLGGRIQQLFSGISGLFESSLFMQDLNSFLERAEDARPNRPPGRPAGALQELQADDVSFRYPGSERDALSGVSISIRDGEVVALVGENGSGKTTLAKLLAQMFDPTGGRILWNGEESRELDPATIRDQIGVIFQDYVRYQLSARENVGFGRPSALNDARRLHEAAQNGGAHEFLEQLPEGYETVLGKEFYGGYDLSGGQWQRVALARAFFRDAALLVLDEPTASLDARSEHQIFEHVAELAHGRSLLLISHRFSTVKSADRIYVLDAGRVIEEGSHDELMAQGGRYAELFDLQARAYR